MTKIEQRCTGCGTMMPYNPASVWHPWVSVTTWSANEYYCLDRCWKAMQNAVSKMRQRQATASPQERNSQQDTPASSLLNESESEICGHGVLKEKCDYCSGATLAIESIDSLPTNSTVEEKS